MVKLGYISVLPTQQLWTHQPIALRKKIVNTPYFNQKLQNSKRHPKTPKLHCVKIGPKTPKGIQDQVELWIKDLRETQKKERSHQKQFSLGGMSLPSQGPGSSLTGFPDTKAALDLLEIAGFRGANPLRNRSTEVELFATRWRA